MSALDVTTRRPYATWRCECTCACGSPHGHPGLCAIALDAAPATAPADVARAARDRRDWPLQRDPRDVEAFWADPANEDLWDYGVRYPDTPPAAPARVDDPGAAPARLAPGAPYVPSAGLLHGTAWTRFADSEWRRLDGAVQEARVASPPGGPPPTDTPPRSAGAHPRPDSRGGVPVRIAGEPSGGPLVTPSDAASALHRRRMQCPSTPPGTCPAMDVYDCGYCFDLYVYSQAPVAPERYEGACTCGSPRGHPGLCATEPDTATATDAAPPATGARLPTWRVILMLEAWRSRPDA
jgi:hypothetical protein